MSDFKVRVNSQNFNIKVGSQQKYKVNIGPGGVVVPARFSDLIDFDGQDTNDQYVMMYNGATGKWTAVNPDKVLSAAAVTEPTQVGFPTDFVDKLDTDLDNKINVDGGGF